jgi:tRNA threonylcarbamoyladenosine biosynthesis protein TsaE
VKIASGTTISSSRDETFQLGFSLGCSLTSPDVFLLKGQLGSGKTVFAKGLICGLGCLDPDDVTSPSFTLINEYSLRLKVYHVDLYRLETVEELHTLDLEGIFAEPAVVIVEWAEKLKELVPQRAVLVCMTDLGEDIRRIEIQPWLCEPVR